MERRRYTSYSPYASPPRRGRAWPWVLGVLAILCVLSASGLLVRSGLSRADEQEFAMLSQRGEGTPEDTPAPTPSPTQTPEPTPTTIAVEDPTETAQTWFELSSKGDFAGLYGLLSTESRNLFSRDDFVTRYTDVYREAGIRAVTGRITGELSADNVLPVELTIESSLYPALTQANELPLVKEESRWLVDWSPSLIFSQLGDTGCIDYRANSAARGRILDRNGEVLAEDIEVLRVGVVPAEMIDPAASLAALSEIIDMPAADIQAKIEREAVDPSWFIAIKDLPSQNSTDVINRLGEIDGVAARRATARSYPYGEVAAHVTGWVSRATEEDVLADETGLTQPDQIIGQAGIEYGANALLAGQPGGELLVVDCNTRAERETITESEGTPPQDVYLTIDIALQQEVDEAMAALQGDERGAAVLLDPRTGAVLAMVSRPSFDPNLALTGSFDEEERARIEDETLRPMADRATYERYPTGSIFKVITAAAAMKYLGFSGDTPIDCPASFSIGDSVWNDWVVENGLSAQGELTLHTGLVQSCNTVFYQLGAELDQEDPNYLPEMAKAFGLGAKTGIPYFPEIAGTVPDPAWKQEVVGDGWATGDAVNLSIGQGFLEATPLQMANVYAAIANGGTLLQPYIVDKTQAPGAEPVQVGKRTVIREIPLEDAQIEELQSALRDQTSNDRGVGSSKVFGDMEWPISGKTGTAQNGDVETDKPHSWFAAYGPADEGDTPTIASCVLVESVGEGVSYAAPVTRRIYDWYVESDLADSGDADE